MIGYVKRIATVGMRAATLMTAWLPALFILVMSVIAAQSIALHSESHRARTHQARADLLVAIAPSASSREALLRTRETSDLIVDPNSVDKAELSVRSVRTANADQIFVGYPRRVEDPPLGSVSILAIGFVLAGLAALVQYDHARSAAKRADAIAEVLQQVRATSDLRRRASLSGRGDPLDALASQVNATLDRLEWQVRCFSDLAKRVSHELLEPLAGIALALRSAIDPEQARSRALQRTDAAVELFRAIVGLAESQFASSDEIAPVDLDRVVYACTQKWADDDRTTSKNIVLEIDRVPARILAFQTQIERVVDNLLSNAVKYSRADSLIQLRIERLDTRKGHFVALHICDEGAGLAGFPEGWREGRGGRGPAAEGVAGGGVGLSFVVAVVKNHGARLHITDREDGKSGAHVKLIFQRLSEAAQDP